MKKKLRVMLLALLLLTVASADALTFTVDSINYATISNEMFYGCSNLQLVSIPEGVTTIVDSAFLSCI